VTNFFATQKQLRRPVRISVSAFDRSHEITNRLDLIGDYVCHLEARNLTIYRDYDF
jgi:hypothetical protein